MARAYRALARAGGRADRLSARRPGRHAGRSCSSAGRHLAPRALLNGPTTTWSARLPGRCLPRWPISTLNWAWHGEHRTRRALVVRLPIASARIGPRCAAAGGAGHRVAAAAAPGSLMCAAINDYSVQPGVIGTRCARRPGRCMFCDGIVADHERIRAAHQTVSDPAHVEAAKVLRRRHFSAASPVVEPRCRSAH